jgi:hypothetical protein
MKLRLPHWQTWLGLGLFALAVLLALAGCGPVLRSPGDPAPGLHDGPAGVLHRLALVASWLAGAGLIACAVAAVFVPNKYLVGKAAIACVAVLLGAQVAYWLADHLAIAAGMAAVCLALCAVGWVWLHRKAIEKRTGIDLDFDKRLG